MSKSLELRTFPHWEHNEICYANLDGLDSPVNVDYWIACKRFTDEELAAEVHYSVFHEGECELRGLKLGEGHPHFAHYLKWNHEFARRSEIINRFATLPHYDEPAS